jgi:subtilisin-like proprotein convertase family protein
MRARLLFVVVLLNGCSSVTPRYGEATISSAAPEASLSGTTFGEAPSLELAPGCPGYLDPAQPAHLVHVTEENLELHLRVRSNDGPIALAVARGDEVRCDSDGGAGHAPSLSFTGPGVYQVYVAALRAPAALAYTLTASTRAAAGELPVASDGARDVSVTITSAPSGATVRDADGRTVGTTPAMFVLTIPAGQAPEERSWAVDKPGHHGATVTGSTASPALVLHAVLAEQGPAVTQASASGPVAIRDYQSARLAIDVSADCRIRDAEVEVDVRHSYVQDLRVVLVSPWREELTLQRHSGAGRRDLQHTWRMSEVRALAPLAGRPGRGRWELVVYDDAGADQGTLDRFDLRLTCGDGPAVAATSTPQPDPHPHPTTPRPSNLPELPTHSDIVAVLARLRPNVERRCGGQAGNVRVYFTVAGATGTVRELSTSGTAARAQQTCVAGIVRGARFPRFRRGSLDVDYTYDIGRTRPTTRPRRPPGDFIDPWSNGPL